jgi:RNA polymerase sigma-70 factor (ECF subfamily)
VPDIERMGTSRLAEETAFAVLVERHRRELHVHCYRMLGSFEELMQETFLRAWRSREGFDGGPLFRAFDLPPTR